MNSKLSLLSLVAGMVLATGVAAAPITWTLSTALPGPVPGSLSFTSDGETINVYGYSTANSNNGSGLFKKQTLNGGLGVSSTGESTGSPNNAVDTDGLDELVIFEFDSADWEAEGVRIGWSEYTSGESRPDIRVWVGGEEGIDFTTTCFTGCPTTLASLGFSSVLFEDVAVGTTLSLSGLSGKYVIVTGDYSIADGENCEYQWVKVSGRYVKKQVCTPIYTHDYFKVDLVRAKELPPPYIVELQEAGTLKVPEPGTLMLLGLALLGLANSRHRNNNKSC